MKSSPPTNSPVMPAFAVPVVREQPLPLEPTEQDTFGGLTGTHTPHP